MAKNTNLELDGGNLTETKFAEGTNDASKTTSEQTANTAGAETKKVETKKPSPPPPSGAITGAQARYNATRNKTA